MILSIIHSTKFVSSVISHNVHGAIHSVYRKTININLNGQLIAIQCFGSPVSPLSLISNLTENDFDALDVEPGMSVTVTPNEMLIHRDSLPDIHIDYSSANILPTYFDHHISTSGQKSLCTEIHKVLASETCDGLAKIGNTAPNEELPLYLQVAKNDLVEALTAFREGHWQESALKLGKMIGLGIGLTPCGDDFLCGATAALTMRGLEDHPFTTFLNSYISEHLADTNDISSAFLSCAVNHHYSQAVHLLAGGLSHCEIDNVFSKIGHSSGMDTLCGIYYILTLEF